MNSLSFKNRLSLSETRLLPFLIILSVFLFNLPYLFTDTLWHDDGLWFYWASSGVNVAKFAWKAKLSVLMPYVDYLYSYGMVYFGLPFTRGVFVFIMALSSLSLYYLYRNVIGLDPKVAVPAAVLPNILPSLSGIPVGLNTSYAMWGLLPILVSLLILKKAFDTGGVKSWIIAGFAFAFYLIGLNLAESANFLVPSMVLFFVMFFPANKFRAFFYGLPFLLYGLWHLYKQFLYSHVIPTRIPFIEAMDRIRHFFEMASFLPFNQPYSLYITVGLTIFGIFGLLSMDKMLYRQPAHFNYAHNIFRLMLLCWPLCWIVANSLPYVALAPEFRAYDYAYVFNFGAVMLQAVGLLFLFALTFRILHIRAKIHAVTGVLVASAILFTGFQRVQYRYSDWSQKPDREKTSAFIRENLPKDAIPQEAQIIVLDIEGQGLYPGNYMANSGYLRYLLRRNDVSGLIGSDRYPNDIFSRGVGWFATMRNLEAGKPIVVFRSNGETLERVNLLLQVASTGRKELPRLQWTLYDVSSMQELPRILATGKGMLSYSTYIHNELPAERRHDYIAFAPKTEPDDFIDYVHPCEIAQAQSLINSEVNFGDYVTLRKVWAVPDKEGYQVQALVRIDNIPDKEHFRLGYRLDHEGKGEEVFLWDYVIKGDHLLLHLSEATKTKLIEGISFEMMNIGSWPSFKTLPVQDGEYVGAESINLRFASDGNFRGTIKKMRE